MAAIDDLIAQIEAPALRARIAEEVGRLAKQKKFGLVFEEHLPEVTPLYEVPLKRGAVAARPEDMSRLFYVAGIEGDIATCVEKGTKAKEEIPVSELVTVASFGEPIYPYLEALDSVENAPSSALWHTLIEADNYHALQLLDYLYHGKVDCIYIDPPYNTGAKDWKYNNDYVDGNDQYRHSKWLSMMQRRLHLAKGLLNPKDSVLIVTIDEKEYLHLGCLLEEMFPEARIQMVSTAINGKGVARENEFARVNEYVFFVRVGSSGVNPLALADEWLGNIKTTTTKKVRWGSLMRSGTGALRNDSPGCFYPVFISEDKKKIIRAGEPIPIGVDRNTIKAPKGQIVLWPIHSNGKEGRWQYGKNGFEDIQKKGYVRISTQTNRGVTLRYISEGWQKRVEEGLIKTHGFAEDGSLMLDDDNYEKQFIPGNQWWIPSHDATEFGSKELSKIIGKRFSFPKSPYAVHDTLRFFVANKPNALILDFFAGSGTTLHAVNLLNAEDGGNRRCILVTNNEVSAEEAKALTKNGHKPGDEAWERLGIARYVTWPRTVCSIEGHDVDDAPLKGNYLGSDRPMADGFAANAAFFHLGFLDKNAVARGAQLEKLLSLLWLKAGAIGKCPEAKADDKMMIFPENRFAVLVNSQYAEEFRQELSGKQIKVAYIITDYENEYKSIADSLHVSTTYQLYRDYLDNFTINTGRD